MAGIHLPDIGRLGIHVATGVNDKKKVAPINNVEEARLKAFLKRVENEKHERGQVIKKELRRMKRRKRRIDARLEDLGRSKTVPLTIERKHLLKRTTNDSHLPPILKTPAVKKATKKLCDQEGAILHDNDTRLVSKVTVFPIQDELENQANTPVTNSATLPPLRVSRIVFESKSDATGKKKSEKSQRKVSTVRKTSSESSSKIAKRVRSVSVEFTGDNGTYHEESNDGDQAVDLPDANILFFGFDAAEILRPRQPQQSLEDAMIAIKTCRYLRTPSRQEHNQDVYTDDA